MGIIMTTADYLKQVDEVIANGPFKDTWESLSQFKMPKWFEKAKFGIFIHWGLYSVPAYNNEWYSRNMYVQGTPEFEHHIKTYGPQKDFGYKDFIPMFTADKFDPDKWANTFVNSGAKYVFPVAEHHDGFQMYHSELSQFNSVNMGPKRDILGELKEAFEKVGLTFCTSSHRAEHWWFMGNGREFESDIKDPMKCGDFYWPSVKDPEDQHSLYTKPYPNEEFMNDWLARTCELIDHYQPKVLYYDWWIQHIAWKPYLKKLTAYYYNRGHEWSFPTAICYKHDAMMFGSGVVDVERGKFSEVKPYHWQTDTAVAHNSWCYTTTLDYKSSYEIICYLADVVSKNRNLLLNIGPKADGTIPEGDAKILDEVGSWLKTNGEAIYNSTFWRLAEEGPTAESEGQFNDSGESIYTSEDFRFTIGNGYLYVISLKYPEDGNITIKSLKNSPNPYLPHFHGIVEEVSILGFDETIDWVKNNDGLSFTTSSVSSCYPVVIKVKMT